MGSENPRATRHQKRFAARFGQLNLIHDGQTLNLSERGVALRTQDVYPPGTQLRVAVKPTDRPAFALEGVVVWALTAGETTHFGIMGIRLTAVDERYMTFLRAATESGAWRRPSMSSPPVRPVTLPPQPAPAGLSGQTPRSTTLPPQSAPSGWRQPGSSTTPPPQPAPPRLASFPPQAAPPGVAGQWSSLPPQPAPPGLAGQPARSSFPPQAAPPGVAGQPTRSSFPPQTAPPGVGGQPARSSFPPQAAPPGVAGQPTRPPGSFPSQMAPPGATGQPSRPPPRPATAPIITPYAASSPPAPAPGTIPPAAMPSGPPAFTPPSSAPWAPSVPPPSSVPPPVPPQQLSAVSFDAFLQAAQPAHAESSAGMTVVRRPPSTGLPSLTPAAGNKPLRMPRFQAELPIQWGTKDIDQTGATINLSRTGISMSISAALAPGARVKFTIHMNDGAPARGAGVTVWQRAAGASGTMQVGLRVLHADNRYYDLLDQLARN